MAESNSSFKRGRRKTGGRKKGTPNKATVEGHSLCRQLVTNEEYQRRFRERFVKGELPAHLEGMIWHYAFGKPRQTEDPLDSDEGPSELRITVVPSRVMDPKSRKCIYDPFKEMRRAKERAGLPVRDEDRLRGGRHRQGRE